MSALPLESGSPSCALHAANDASPNPLGWMAKPVFPLSELEAATAEPGACIADGSDIWLSAQAARIRRAAVAGSARVLLMVPPTLVDSGRELRISFSAGWGEDVAFLSSHCRFSFSS